MTIEEIKALDIDGIEARTSEIREAMNAEDADIAALSAEVDALTERKAEIAKANADFAELRDKVAKTENKTIEKMEDNKMNLQEIRSSEAYINAFANYVKTGNDTECRAILTDNAEAVSTAKVPTPVFISDIIQHAWENLTVLSRTTQTNLKGNVKVGVEIDADDAQIHKEGAAAISEEELTLKVVELVPETIKKWISISDELLDISGRAFLEYVYSELAYKIFHKAEDLVIADIVADADGLTVKSVPTASVSDFINAVAKLSDEATNTVIIMNKQSYAYYKNLQMQANYSIDVFDGMPVLFNNSLAAVTSSTLADDTVYAIVGDLKAVQTNFTNGKDVTFKYDDTTLATSDLVRVIGRMPMGHGIVGYKKLAVLKTEA